MTGRQASPEDIERGLTALILAGTSTVASEETGISENTLRSWKRKHADRYDRLCSELEPRVVQKIAAEAESIVLSIADRERKLVEALTDDAIASLAPKDITSSLRNLSTSKALQIDKLSSPLRERPSHVQSGTDVEGILLRMARALGEQTPTRVPNQAHTDSTALALTPESANPNARE